MSKSKLTVISAKIPEEVYKEFVLRVSEGERSGFIRDAIFEKLQNVPRPDKIFELESRINKLETSLGDVKKSLAELEILTQERGETNPYSFCVDNIDRKIMDFLLQHKGATTTELAETLETNRWLILNRLRKIAKRSRKQLGKPIVEYNAGMRSGKKKAWWIDTEAVEA